MHQFDLKNRTAVITGGAQGFGLDIARKFLISGANVIIWDIDEKELQNAVKKINNPKLAYNIIDVSNFEKVNNTVIEINKLSNIDILINNAGITGPTAELWNYSINDWNKVVEINLNGTFNCCKSIVPNMVKNNYGRIVNIASVAGKDGNANASAYSSAKAAVLALTKALGKELAEKNIAVNAVTPAGNYSIKDWNKVVEINLNGTFNCCKSIVPNMVKNNYGRIVNIASVAGKDGNANASAYSSAKAAVLALTKALGHIVQQKLQFWH